VTNWKIRRGPEDPLADPRDETLTRRLIEGPDDPREALAALGDVDSTSQAEVEEILGLLDAAGRHERDAIAAARSGEETVLSADEVRELSRRAAGASDVWLGRWAAAAVLLILALGIGTISERGRDAGASDPGPMLGSELEALGPVGTASFERFEWRAERMPGGWFEVVVHDAEDLSIVDRSPELEQPSWTPATTERWPDSIVWELTVYDGNGLPTDSGRFEATRPRQ